MPLVSLVEVPPDAGLINQVKIITQNVIINDQNIHTIQPIDSLVSDSADNSLSANQGKIIKGGLDAINTSMGTLASLTTTAKGDLVSAINEVHTGSGASTIGDLDAFFTRMADEGYFNPDDYTRDIAGALNAIADAIWK